MEQFREEGFFVILLHIFVQLVNKGLEEIEGILLFMRIDGRVRIPQPEAVPQPNWIIELKL